MIKNLWGAVFQARQPSAGMHVPAKHFEARHPPGTPFPGVLFKYLPANEKTRRDRRVSRKITLVGLSQADSTFRR
jgi:hypothetical protein